ncbi:MAG: alpha/beta fold hydrolase [Bacteroidales bacterium]
MKFQAVFPYSNAMQPFRTYGPPPCAVVLIHGGPGAPGSLAPLANLLKTDNSLLEPFQQNSTIGGQVKEMYDTISRHGNTPVVLVGHSWGAWLGWIFAAEYPKVVKKLIMIGAGPFEEKYAENISRLRRQRLSPEEHQTVQDLAAELKYAQGAAKKEIFRKLGRLMTKADTFAPVSDEEHVTRYQPEIYESIWPEAAALRASGKLINLAARIRCPVTAIHGDYDPHPAEGVEIPLSESLNDFRMIRMQNCGHYPWNERYAAEEFASILLREIA